MLHHPEGQADVAWCAIWVAQLQSIPCITPELLCAGGTQAASGHKRKVKKQASQRLPQPLKDTAAGHTYDYFKDRWDKFDVDAALAEADEETEYESSEDEQPDNSKGVCLTAHIVNEFSKTVQTAHAHAHLAVGCTL
jgi:hypothetical protein